MNFKQNRYSRPFKLTSGQFITPSFMACACASCAISFGVIFLVAGLIVNAVSSVSPTSPFRDNPFFQQSREDFSSTPRFISIVLMSIGGAFVALSLLFMIISLVAYKKYGKQPQNNSLANNSSPHPETEIVRQSNQSINNIIENEEKIAPNKGDINTIGLPIYLPHNGFSYTAYPSVYIQKKKQNSTNVVFSKESQI